MNRLASFVWQAGVILFAALIIYGGFISLEPDNLPSTGQLIEMYGD